MVKKIKLSDFVADFISKKGVKTVFAISGGASLHLIHSINDHESLNYVCTHHEQGAAMAADGYSRVTGNIGVAISTSGPGATNLITGLCCSFYDSVPLLVITGQVSTFRMTGKTGVRQIGFQETPITAMTKEITKYSKTIKDPYEILYELEKATYLAFEGRPGPVLLDIPDNLQRELIDISKLRKFSKKDLQKNSKKYLSIREAASDLVRLIQNSERPVAIGGWGLHLSKTEKLFIKFVRYFSLPVALTWGASDVLPSDDPLYIGTFGTHGMRHANFAVQNSDLIISLGSRLDTKATGSPISTFAREAKKIIVDIDPNELGKFKSFNLEFDLLIQEDLNIFFKELFALKDSFKPSNYFLKKHIDWQNNIIYWKKKVFHDNTPKNYLNKYLDPYNFFETLSKVIGKGSHVFIDTGCSIAWAMQKMKFKTGTRVFHDFNNTAMGWALPASIGAYFANSKKDLICIVGDGSLMMTLQELATVMHHKINIKLIVVNNNGYSMIKQTQEQWLDSKYIASSNEGGLSFPDYKKISDAFNLKFFKLNQDKDLELKLELFLKTKKSSLIEVLISPQARVEPQVKFGRPNEDMEPLVPRDIFLKNMIIEPLKISTQEL